MPSEIGPNDFENDRGYIKRAGWILHLRTAYPNCWWDRLSAALATRAARVLRTTIPGLIRIAERRECDVAHAGMMATPCSSLKMGFADGTGTGDCIKGVGRM